MSTPDYIPWLITPEVQRAMDVINRASPDHAATLAGALLEDLLKRLIGRSTREVLTKDLQKLGNRQCLNWAYRLALIDKKLYDELGVLMTIRNYFAHGWRQDVDFNTPHIESLVKKLKSPGTMLRPGLDTLPNIEAIRAELHSSNESWWAASVGGVMADLRDLGDKAKRPDPPTPKDW